mmetsp:Transcript_27974/g.68122  ORF Transcript_27974/g.68122 Transcript_27974/m.68122 type:complete len:308 (+) Transcript_27974:1-924(+)
MLFGLFMLWWGWIGFNCGSTFGITDNKWIVAARAGVSTLNTASAGGIVAMIYSRYRSGGQFIHPGDVVNGILGALVTSSPTCATVHTYDPLIIGAIGSLFTNWINDRVMKKWLRLDDPVGAIGVHLGGGLWGCIAVGLFADKNLPGTGLDVSGLFRGGGFELLGRQLIGLAAITAWSLVTMPPFFYIVGVLFSKDWRHPRKGLRHEYIQMDRNIHGCCEDPTDKITVEIEKALRVLERQSHRLSQQSMMALSQHTRTSQSGILTGIRDGHQSYGNNLSMSGRSSILDANEDTETPDSTSDSSGELTL